MSAFQILERLKPSTKKEIKEIEKELSLSESILARLVEKKTIARKESVDISESKRDGEITTEKEDSIEHFEKEMKKLRGQMDMLLENHKKMIIRESGFDE